MSIINTTPILHQKINIEIQDENKHSASVSVRVQKEDVYLHSDLGFWM